MLWNQVTVQLERHKIRLTRPPNRNAYSRLATNASILPNNVRLDCTKRNVFLFHQEVKNQLRQGQSLLFPIKTWLFNLIFRLSVPHVWQVPIQKPKTSLSTLVTPAHPTPERQYRPNHKVHSSEWPRYCSIGRCVWGFTSAFTLGAPLSCVKSLSCHSIVSLWHGKHDLSRRCICQGQARRV